MPAALKWFIAKGLVFDAVNNNPRRKRQAVGSGPPAIFLDKCCMWGTICRQRLHFQTYIYNMVHGLMLFLWSLNVATRGKPNTQSRGRFQNWLVILGPCSESLLYQTQRGTVSSQTVARAVVFNYGQAVKIEMWLYAIVCCFQFLFLCW